MRKRIDLVGQKFGRLTVLEDVGRRNRKVLWRCLCDCGNIIEVTGSNLQSGNTQSCGCYKRERISEINYLNRIGQVFGRLTVLEDVGRQHEEVLWRCLCECGNIVEVSSNHLQSGHTQSCGCLQKERVSEAHKKDLTGQRFGKLTVLEDVGRSKVNGVIWKCICDCGNTVDVITASLQSGNTQSCGCYKKERLSETHLGGNHHNWKGGITPLYSTIRNCVPYKEWRFSVFKRDTFLCQVCNQPKRKLNAHHIKHFSTLLKEHNITTLEEAIGCEALWDIDNGVTLCKKCHKKEHASMKRLGLSQMKTTLNDFTLPV
jgi:hypothetical protein